MTDAVKTERLLYSRNEAAQQLSVSPRTIGNLLASGKLRHVKIGTRTLISGAELRRLASKGAPSE